MLPVKTALQPTISRFFGDDWTSLFDWTEGENAKTVSKFVPAVNIKELPDSMVVEMAIPGMKREDFKVELNNHTLSIQGNFSKDANEKIDNYVLREFNYSSFQRSFKLNQQVVDDSKIEAIYKDGILRLMIAKKEEAKQKPPVNIQVL